MQGEAFFPYLSFNFFCCDFVLTLFFLTATSSVWGLAGEGIREKVKYPLVTSTEHVLYFSSDVFCI